ncbi:MAG: PqqD family protein [Paraprevotella sp.]|nr:PqqD family protein [Paraprevotella sp.]
MRIKDGFELREICGEFVILSHGVDNIDFSKLISLNETAAHMWKSVVDKDFDNAMLAEALCEVYEVDRETAEQDVARVVSQWKEIGLIE